MSFLCHFAKIARTKIKHTRDCVHLLYGITLLSTSHFVLKGNWINEIILFGKFQLFQTYFVKNLFPSYVIGKFSFFTLQY